MCRATTTTTTMTKIQEHIDDEGDGPLRRFASQARIVEISNLSFYPFCGGECSMLRLEMMKFASCFENRISKNKMNQTSANFAILA